MITNLAWFALLPVIILASHNSVSAEELIVPALGEPIQPIPVDTTLDPDKIALGALLFKDTRLSKDNKLSCASCHQLDSGGDDGMITGISLDGNVHVVNTPTIFNARFNFRQQWDGAALSLEDQVDHVLHNHMEAGSNWNELLAKLNRDSSLVDKFENIYNDGITMENYLDALTEFERSLVTPNSRFDQYLLGNYEAITDDEKKGYLRFKELGCISCHQGVNVGGNLFQKFGIFYDYLAERGDIINADYGRINVTNREIDMHVFKVPTLRNIELTAPYLHDGKAETLEQVIAIMGKTQIGKTISNEDVDLIAKFLKTLTGEYKGAPLAQNGNSSVKATLPEEMENNDNNHNPVKAEREKS
jgi:cytochrome c peroxidase